MCVCNSTGNTLVWRTSITGGTVATFGPDAMVGENDTDGGFTAVLAVRANGVSVSTLTFNPSTVSAAGSGGVDVTCEGTASTSTTNIAVTFAGTFIFLYPIIFIEDAHNYVEGRSHGIQCLFVTLSFTSFLRRTLKGES